MKQVLVTGAAGFIGIQVVKELLNEKCQVFALIEKDDEGSRNRLMNVDDGIEIIDDSSYLFANSKSFPTFDQIFHLATVGVRPDFNDIKLICDVNIKLGCQLVDFARDNGSGLLVNFGSCFEYGDHGDVLLTEDFSCKPESLYAISKNASTTLLNAYAKMLGVHLITVRPFGVFGEGEGSNRLAPSIIRKCLKGETVETTLGEQVRDFVNVKDVARAIVCLANAGYTDYEIYNICSNNPVSVRAFIEEIVEVCGFDLSLVQFGSMPYRQNEAMVFAGNNDKLQKLINYPFPDHHREGIQDIYNALVKGNE